MPRPSGTRQTPARASASGATPLTSRPQTSTLPELRHDLARLRPRASSTCRRRSGRAARRPRPAAARGRRRAARRCGRSRRDTPTRARARGRSSAITRPPSVARPVPRYAACTAGSAWISAACPGDDRPKSSTWMCAHVLHHERHVVLDEQDAEPVGGEVEQQLAERVGLVLVEARRRLVEQQHLGSVASARASSTRRAVPVGSASTCVSATSAMPTRSSSSSATVVGVVRSACPSAAASRRDEHVLACGQAAEHLEPLERARDPEPRPLVRARAR